jgi:hypothetical protein
LRFILLWVRSDPSWSRTFEDIASLVAHLDFCALVDARIPTRRNRPRQRDTDWHRLSDPRCAPRLEPPGVVADADLDLDEPTCVTMSVMSCLP